MKTLKFTLIALGLTFTLSCLTSCEKEDHSNDNNRTEYDEHSDDWGKRATSNENAMYNGF